MMYTYIYTYIYTYYILDAKYRVQIFLSTRPKNDTGWNARASVTAGLCVVALLGGNLAHSSL